ncbi:MAG: tRNA dimethylallyltransferase [Chlamydiota bacterium]
MSLSSSHPEVRFGIDPFAEFAQRSELFKKKVIVIAGPTGVGKTAVSLLVAKAIGGEIVSADSMLVYRGMDIGTAKPSLTDRQEVVHHLVDSRDLDETFNVVEYYQEATLAIKEILDKGAVPIVVGGTGFYLHALLYGPPKGPPSDPAMRALLENEIDLRGTEAMYQKLVALDPQYARTITAADRQKIVRALEIITLSSKTVSSFAAPSPLRPLDYNFRCWFLHMEKERLYSRIEDRCDEMLAAGFVKEVEGLQTELRRNPTASQAIGYKQCLLYLDSLRRQEDWQAFVTLFKQASRRYAKRQMTWFRKEKLFRWLDRDLLSIEQVAEIVLQDYELNRY